LDHYNIEIGSGLGPLKGKIWRIGLMGESCSDENIALVLSALKDTLSSI
jgi:alanine-glyoxylate transaminase/serine-glyoxylate transaminase/serine-pyruvate transaminase